MGRPKKSVEAAVDVDAGTVTIPVDGEARIDMSDLSVQEIEPARDIYGLNDKARQLAFNEEKVTIYLHESGNPNDEQAVFLAINGEPVLPGNPWLLRGREYTIKRKFVEQLIRAQGVSFSQPKPNSNDEEEANSFRARRAMRYPFDYRSDSNPQGMSWFRRLMAA